MLEIYFNEWTTNNVVCINLDEGPVTTNVLRQTNKVVFCSSLKARKSI